jgi:glucosyl-dolichyl phosphate glucuronosyltransferase
VNAAWPASGADTCLAEEAPTISVILCTYNRGPLLPAALHSLLDQELAWKHYEVVVVDNGSTDDTASRVERVREEFHGAPLRLVFENRRGLSNARNRGLSEARGEILGFTDDDVRVPRSWLRDALEGFCALPLPGAVGGPVFPAFQKGRPAWFKDEYETDSWGSEERFLERGESFSGNNMFFRRSLLASVGGFDAGLGMQGEWIGVAEETRLFERIWQLNPAARLRYLPNLRILHEVPAHRMRVSYVVKRGFVIGQAWHVRNGERSLTGRIRGLGSATGVLLRGIRQASRGVLRHDAWQQWVVEDTREVVAGLGRLAAVLGLHPRLRERPNTGATGQET